jgi:RNA polymerase sigma-70 factor, ECF subfamily
VRALDKLTVDSAMIAVRPWLFTIMRNLFISRWRTTRTRPAVVSSDAVETEEPPVGPEQDGALARLDRLANDQRQVLLLVSVAGLEYSEVAGILRIPVGRVMSRLSRARDSLRAYMDGHKRPLLRRVK